MRLRLEATPEELREKGEALIGELAKSLAPLDPDLAQSLEKALPRKEQGLKFPVLREIAKRQGEAYDKLLKRMLKDIGKVLDRSTKTTSGVLAKAEFYDHTGPIVDKDEIGYQRVKAVLMQYGYTEADYQEGGSLYGMSVNELIELAKKKAKT
jgi:hypothetical protein